MPLVDENLKAEAAKAMDHVFQTFKRDKQITFYKVEKRTVVMEDPNFISGFNKLRQNNVITEETRSASFDARVWYLDEQPVKNAVGLEEIGVRVETTWGQIKIQVEQDGYDFLKDAEKVVFLGEEYRIDDDVRRIGILDEFKYYMFKLRRDN